jgi:hypothetical protein
LKTAVDFIKGAGFMVPAGFLKTGDGKIQLFNQNRSPKNVFGCSSPFLFLGYKLFYTPNNVHVFT